MARQKTDHVPIEQHISEFERQNPRIAQALQVFDMSIEAYQEAIHAMVEPRVYLETSTVPAAKRGQHAELGARQPRNPSSKDI